VDTMVSLKSAFVDCDLDRFPVQFGFTSFSLIVCYCIWMCFTNPKHCCGKLWQAKQKLKVADVDCFDHVLYVVVFFSRYPLA